MTPSATPSSDPPTRSFDVERAIQLSAFAGLIAYTVGLLIVNMYLFQIGESDFAVLRTRFVLTGDLALLMFAGLGAFVFTGILTVSAFTASQRMRQGQATRRSRIAAILGSEIVLYCAVSLLAATLIVPWLNASGIRIRASLLGSLFYGGDMVFLIAMTIIGILHVSLAKPFVGEAPEAFARRPFWYVGSFLAGAFLYGSFGFFSIDFFASTVYPVVPEQVGGGRPKQVRIVMSPDRSEVGTALGFGPTMDGPTVRSVDLLWETEQMYVVRDDGQPNSPVIQIDRDVAQDTRGWVGIPPSSRPRRGRTCSANIRAGPRRAQAAVSACSTRQAPSVRPPPPVVANASIETFRREPPSRSARASPGHRSTRSAAPSRGGAERCTTARSKFPLTP